MEIFCNRESLILSADRVVYWPAKRAVILADMHLGKTGYFRERGIPIPSTVMHDDLQRLSRVIDTFQPEKMIIAGDMFHHNYNADIDIFKYWRRQQTHTEFILVPGNHDKMLPIDYEKLDIRLAPELFSPGFFAIRHEPSAQPAQFEINGHLHPGCVIKGRARQALRLPCFVVTSSQVILPAFSLFTGLFTGFKTGSPASYYAIANDMVVKLNGGED